LIRPRPHISALGMYTDGGYIASAPNQPYEVAVQIENHWLPAWIRNRSWWVKWSFGGGLAFLSAFLPTVLELSWQKLGVGVGIVLFSISVIGGTWEGINEWRIKHQRNPLPKIPPRVFVLMAATPLMGIALYCERPITPIDIASSPKLTDRPDLVSMFVRDLRPPLGFEVRGCTDYDEADRKGMTYYKIIGDVPANSKFLSFYIPKSQYSLRIIESIADEYNEWIVPVENTLHVHNHVQGNTSPVESQDMVFSNVIYVYHEDSLDAVQIGTLTKKYNDKKLTLQLRGFSYLMGAWDAIKAGRINKIAQYKINGCRIVPVT